MNSFEPSHAVAVTGYVYHEGRFLLLKRATPPLIWAPPGGRLLPNEDPREGVVREVLEETGLKPILAGLSNYWFGEIGDRGFLLSLDFVLISNSDNVQLSDEHSDLAWATLLDLKSGKPDLGSEAWSFRPAHFEEAENAAQKYLSRGDFLANH